MVHSVIGPSKENTMESLIDKVTRDIRQSFNSLTTNNKTLQMELEQVRDSLFPAVHAFVELLEGRDLFTYGHSRRVARYCVQFADYLGWTVDQIKLLNVAALLHDIGKIIIPDTVLHKNGKFTALEFETMKLHSSTGSRILHRLAFWGKEVEGWILHHHERFDGKGYPDGIKGDNIPVGARILCLADSYDAMTTTRRYREPIPHWVALDEIAACGGRQFDPDLAAKFQVAFPEPPSVDGFGTTKIEP